MALLALGVTSSYAASAYAQNSATAATVLAQKTSIPSATPNANAKNNTSAPVDNSQHPLEIEGDSLGLHLDRTMRASGNAIVRKDNQTFTGDVIEYDIQNDEMRAEGNVTIKSDGIELKGPKLKIQLTDSLGEMNNVAMTVTNTQNNAPIPQNDSELLSDNAAIISDPKRYVEDNLAYSNKPAPFHFESARMSADKVLFEGQNKKRLQGASFTTCPADSNAWYIKAHDLEINESSQTATAKNAYVQFKGVPILYTPWLSFSYNSQRESGFLAPTIGATSKSGFEVSVPYYWNIRPDMDATITTRYLSKRGTQLQGEYRYLGENYSGIDYLEYLNKDSVTGENRYYANLKHIHTFNSRWSGGFNYEKVSDDKYFSELTTHIVSTSLVNLQQQAYLNYNDDVWSFNGTVQKYQTLDGISFPYQKLPQLTLIGYKEWQGFTGELTTQYTNFTKDITATKVANGNRLIAYPSISYPMTNSFGYITPKIGVHSSYYSLSDNVPTAGGPQYNDLSRTLPIVSLDSGIYLDRETKLFDTSFTQTLEPRMYYVYIPYQDQSKFPVFDTALSDLNQTSLFAENQFVGADRINNANQVTLALTTRLINSETGIERLSATVGQRYSYEDNKVTLPNVAINTRRNSDVLVGVTARLSNKLNLDSFMEIDPDQSRTTRANFLVRYNPEPGKTFNAGYRYTQGNLEQINISGQWPLGNGWYGIGRYNYSIKDNKTVESLAGLEYDGGCWQLRSVFQTVQTATANANTAFFLQLDLGGLASIGSNPFKILRRDIRGYVDTNQIPTIYRKQNLE